MKKQTVLETFKELQQQTVNSIINGDYIVASADNDVLNIKVEGLSIYLWMGDHARHVRTWTCSDISLNPTLEEKEAIYGILIGDYTAARNKARQAVLKLEFEKLQAELKK